jgi:hypothetical protein
VKFQKPLQRDVGRILLNALVRDAMLGATFRTFDLSWNVASKLSSLEHFEWTDLTSDVVDQPFHAGLHTKRVLTWQQFGVAVAIQADGAR